MLAIEVAPISLGIEVGDGKMFVIVPRNSTIPTKHRTTFTTQFENQDATTIAVYAGEDDYVENNVELGYFTLEGIPKGERGKFEIEVTFDISADSILNVVAFVKDTEMKKELNINRDALKRLATVEIDWMYGKLNQLKEEDKQL
eukprot:CAMPEP_0201284098 /NCGR_PEP_ID=MMETSP1317-20130820/61598_1 /ASSEMBLY_ACC=CAM_ASM_000770 /TAXON_ID=187299 /ORGANISM="Undescribed Undescribed, Strain Undescribed" /LENGTH=143 /DNA_ID=CAMNT_0047602777 /DNA_START=335 /DNA_END=762 /DNA_ORIENTATION=-